MVRDYVVTLRHDAGRIRIRIYAESVEDAARRACAVELAPLRAVESVDLAHGSR